MVTCLLRAAAVRGDRQSCRRHAAISTTSGVIPILLLLQDIRQRDSGIRRSLPVRSMFFHSLARGHRASIEQPIQYMDIQVQALACLECARLCSVDKFVYAASSSCYGLAAVRLPKPSIGPNIRMPLSKYQGEQAAFHEHRVYGLPVIRFCIFTPTARACAPPGLRRRIRRVLSAETCGRPYTVGAMEPSAAISSTSPTSPRRFSPRPNAGQRRALQRRRGTQSINRLVELLAGDVVYIPKRPGTDCTLPHIKDRFGLGGSPSSASRMACDECGRYRTLARAPLWTPIDCGATKTWFRYSAAECP